MGFFVLLIRLHPESTRNYTLIPYAPLFRTGVLAVAQDLHAVDENVVDAGRVLLRCGISGVVGDRRRIEHHDVGEAAGLEATAVGQLPVRGGQAGEAGDALGQRHQPAVEPVVAEEAGDVAVGARVRARTQAVGRAAVREKGGQLLEIRVG